MKIQVFTILLIMTTSAIGVPQTEVSTYPNEPSRRLMEGQSVENCWNFTVGNTVKQELFSPNYPSHYPNNTRCINVIEAPIGHLIKMEIRDRFNIESSLQCKYDYLQVRDGPFGYSPSIGQYCGNEPPLPIMSSGRHLWLLFVSDDSIEYEGFRAVYEFVPLTDPEQTKRQVPICHIKSLNHEEREHSLEDVPSGLRKIRPLECTWEIVVPQENRVLILWKSLTLPDPYNCNRNFIEIYDGSTASSARWRRICGSHVRDVFRSETNHVFVHFYNALNIDTLVEFEMIHTAYRPAPCQSFHFDCRDTTCINKTFVCNGKMNCNHSWDEITCDKESQFIDRKRFGNNGKAKLKAGLSVEGLHKVILGVIGGVLFVIIFASIVVTCRHHIRRDRERQSAIRRSHRSAQADSVEMGSLLPDTAVQSDPAQQATPDSTPMRINGAVLMRDKSNNNNLAASNHPVSVHRPRPSRAKEDSAGTSAQLPRYKAEPSGFRKDSLDSEMLAHYMNKEIEEEIYPPPSEFDSSSTYRRYSNIGDDELSDDTLAGHLCLAPVTIERRPSSSTDSVSSYKGAAGFRRPVADPRSSRRSPDLLPTSPGTMFNYTTEYYGGGNYAQVPPRPKGQPKRK